MSTTHRPIRLLMIIADLSGGGTERVFTYLLKHLPRDLFEIQLCLWRNISDYTIPEDIPIHILEKHKPWNIPRTIQRTSRLIDDIRPDMVFSALYFTNILTGEAITRAEHEPAWICRFGNPPEIEMQGLLNLWAHRVFARADRVIVNSEGVRQSIMSHLGLPEERVRTIPNMIDFDELERLAAEPLPFQPRADTLVLVHAGRFHKQKNQSLLLRSFAQLRSIKTELWMLGRGHLETKLRREAQSLGISERVRWLGFQQNPYPFLQAADFFVLSSNWEGSPNAVIEAMACGTAVVSTRCPYGPDELIEDGQTGLLVPVKDTMAMTFALEQFARNPTLRESCAQRGAQSVQRRFSLEDRVQSHVELFDDVIA